MARRKKSRSRKNPARLYRGKLKNSRRLVGTKAGTYHQAAKLLDRRRAGDKRTKIRTKGGKHYLTVQNAEYLIMDHGNKRGARRGSKALSRSRRSSSGSRRKSGGWANLLGHVRESHAR